MQIGVVVGAMSEGKGDKGGDPKVLGKAKKKTKADEGRDAVIERLVAGVNEACAAAKVKVADLAALGIGAPGAIDPTEGLVLEAVNLRWDNVPLAKILKDKLGVPVFLDNDVNAAVYGENRCGAGDNSRDLLGVWAGTGIGGGLILNGSLYYGTNWTAGEIGHMVAMPGNQPGTRTLEQNTSRSSVVDRLTDLILSNHKSIIPSLVDGDLSQVRSKVISKAYEAGDELTLEVVNSAAELLGTCIGGVVTLLSLGRVVLGGGLTEAIGQPFVDLVKKAARREAFPQRCREVKVVMTKLLDDAGVIGSALIAAERLAGRTP